LKQQNRDTTGTASC